jgi:hypothetical protein
VGGLRPGAHRLEAFQENGFPAFAYAQLRPESPADGRNYGYPLSPIHTRDYESYRLDERLYEFGLEGRRVVILAPPYTGPRKDNPADRVAGYLREEGTRVSIVPDQCVLLNEYGRFDEDAEYFEHNEPCHDRSCEGRDTDLRRVQAQALQRE